MWFFVNICLLGSGFCDKEVLLQPLGEELCRQEIMLLILDGFVGFESTAEGKEVASQRKHVRTETKQSMLFVLPHRQDGTMASPTIQLTPLFTCSGLIYRRLSETLPCQVGSLKEPRLAHQLWR